MRWDAFTIIQQVLIVLAILGQGWVSVVVVKNTEGSEQYVRLMALLTGVLIFLLGRPLGLTFADLMLMAHTKGNLIEKIIIAGVMPFGVGIVVAEGAVLAMGMQKSLFVRTMLIVAGFTASQAAYTNYIALSTKVTTLDQAFIPNMCYTIAIGIWMTWRYREIPRTAK